MSFKWPKHLHLLLDFDQFPQFEVFIIDFFYHVHMQEFCYLEIFNSVLSNFKDINMVFSTTRTLLFTICDSCHCNDKFLVKFSKHFLKTVQDFKAYILFWSS